MSYFNIKINDNTDDINVSDEIVQYLQDTQEITISNNLKVEGDLEIIGNTSISGVSLLASAITLDGNREWLTTVFQNFYGDKVFNNDIKLLENSLICTYDRRKDVSGNDVMLENEVLLNRIGTITSTDKYLTKSDTFHTHNSSAGHIAFLPDATSLQSGWNCIINNTNLTGPLHIRPIDSSKLFNIVTNTDITAAGFTLVGSKHTYCSIFYINSTIGFYLTYPFDTIEQSITTLNSEFVNCSDEITVNDGTGTATWKMYLKDNVATLDSSGPTIEIIKQDVPRLTISNSASTFQNKIVGQNGVETDSINIGDLTRVNSTNIGMLNIYNQGDNPKMIFNRHNTNNEITTGNVLGDLEFWGWDHSLYRLGGRLRMRCRGSWSNGDPKQYIASTTFEVSLEDADTTEAIGTPSLTMNTDEATFNTPLLTANAITASGTVDCNRLETGVINASGNLIHSGSTAHLCKNPNDPDERYVEVGSHYIDFHNGTVPANDYDGRIQQLNTSEMKLISDNINIDRHNRSSGTGLMLNGTLVRATATELNLLEGVTSLGGSSPAPIVHTTGSSTTLAYEVISSDRDIIICGPNSSSSSGHHFLEFNTTNITTGHKFEIFNTTGGNIYIKVPSTDKLKPTPGVSSGNDYTGTFPAATNQFTLTYLGYSGYEWAWRSS